MDKKLPVPENVTLRWELWRGMGKAELFVSVSITAVAVVLAFIFCLTSSWSFALMTSIIGVLCTFGFCVGLFTKMDNNQSPYDYLKQQAMFRKEQQVFWYVKKDEAITIVK
jgi:fatty acid desaturase